MKVLVVTNMWPSAERPHWGAFVKSQADSLAALGCENTLYEIKGYRSQLEYLKAVSEIPRVARACGAELVHAHYGLSGAAAARVEAPLVVSFCGDDLLGRPQLRGSPDPMNPVLMQVSQYAARRADRVIVKTKEMRDRIPDVADVHVIPNGVDLTRFVPEPREAARAALGWPQDEDVLLFAGNPDELRKNFPLARETFEALRNHGRRVRLEVFHDRPQVELVRVMNAADVLLLPSFHEGSPNVVKEAMAVNLPVVATEVGDCEELLEDVEPSDTAPGLLAAFALSVHEVLNEKRRSNGREVIERRLSLEVVAKRVLGVYEEALARRRSR